MDAIWGFYLVVACSLGPGQEGEGENSALVKTKAACSADVGQSGKHSLQSQHSFKAISGMKLISLFIPLPTNPIAFFFLTSAQYLTHRPQ